MTLIELVNIIRNEYSIKSFRDVNLELIANSNYIIIEEDDIEEDGLIYYNEYGGLIKINKNISDPGWKRFTIAHELGHFFYAKYINKIKPGEIYQKTDKLIIDKKEEEFVNEFAANLLMPEDEYLKQVVNKHPSLDLFINIAREFNVSLPAAAVRYALIGPIPIAVILCKEGKIEWNFVNKNFPYHYIRNKSYIPYGSGVHNIMNYNLKYFKSIVSVKEWFRYDFKLRGKYNSLEYLSEESIQLSDKKSVLVVLT